MTPEESVAIYRKGTWHIYHNGSPERITWGANDTKDIPIAGFFERESRIELSVYRPFDSTFHIRGKPVLIWGERGDWPVPADYNGDGILEIAVYRPSNGTWHIRDPQTGGARIIQFGQRGDCPVPANYIGGESKAAQIAVYRPEISEFFICHNLDPSQVERFQLGQFGDIPVPGMYRTPGKYEVAVYRPQNSLWYFQDGTSLQWGDKRHDDMPVPFEYFEEKKTDIAVYRRKRGEWHFQRDGRIVAWGGEKDDVPVPARYWTWKALQPNDPRVGLVIVGIGLSIALGFRIRDWIERRVRAAEAAGREGRDPSPIPPREDDNSDGN